VTRGPRKLASEGAKPMTLAEAKKLREMKSAAGRKGGRPPTRFNYADKLKAAQVKATREGRALLPLVVGYWKKVMTGEVSVPPNVREQVAKTIANRFGMPERSVQELGLGDVRRKMFDLGGYRDEAGAWHPVEEDEPVSPDDSETARQRDSESSSHRDSEGVSDDIGDSEE